MPTSDIAGAVVGLGSDVSGDKWKEGDRVVINFNLEHVDGDADPEKVAQSLGGRRDGGLQEYIAVPAYVRTVTVTFGDPRKALTSRSV